MVARILTILWLLAISVAPPAAASQLCLNCHPIHYGRHGSCTSCHRGNPLSGRKNIAHQLLVTGRYAGFSLGGAQGVRVGKTLIEQYACRRCHRIEGRGNRLATDLDSVVHYRAPQELDRSIQHPVAGMPDFRTSETGRVALVTALLASSLRIVQPREQPQNVHFSQSSIVGQDLFSKKCGSCHRALSQRLGALGRGDVGPNLSGLLSVFYPKNYRLVQSWNPADLSSWLKNPRTIRLWSTMQPVSLTSAELQELVLILNAEPDQITSETK